MGVAPIEKVKPSKATPKPKSEAKIPQEKETRGKEKVKAKEMQEKEKDSIPTPEDLLKIHNAARMELKRKQSPVQPGDIFKEFGGKLKSLSNTNSLIEGDKALEAI